MEKKLEDAVKNCATLASKDSLKADEALKYTQAACNAANALMTLKLRAKQD